MKRDVGYIVVMLGLIWTINIQAEEGGSGHYLPSGVGTFIDAFPAKPGGLALFNYTTYYYADASASTRLPLGGLLSLGMRAKVISDTVVALYQTDWSVFGGGIAFGAAIPYVWVDVDAQAQRIGPGGVLGPLYKANDSVDGLGDISLIPVMIGWTNLAPDLKLDARLTVYAPTGEYDAGKLANIGKNYWTFEPGIMVSWLSSRYGTEVSLYSAIDFNTRNDDTDYQTGTSLHFDGTIAQHLPLLGGLAGIGVTGFYYEQIEGDSGSGAVLGDFESKTTGVRTRDLLSSDLQNKPVAGRTQMVARNGCGKPARRRLCLAQAGGSLLVLGYYIIYRQVSVILLEQSGWMRSAPLVACLLWI